jgi:Flp pilus assembly protein TadD
MKVSVLFVLACSLLSKASADDYVIDEDAEAMARAQSLHDAALKMAMDGNEADALYDFEAASELDPTNAGFMSDLGVVQMRLGLLDEVNDLHWLDTWSMLPPL